MAEPLIRAGELRHRAEIQTLTGSVSAYGDSPGTLETRCTRQCSIRPASSRERTEAKQVQSDVSHIIEMHYDPIAWSHLSHKAELLINGARRFYITSVFNVQEMGRVIQITANEKV